MAANPINSTTGKAQIRKTGHTAGKRYGADDRAQVKGSNPSRDLGIR